MTSTKKEVTDATAVPLPAGPPADASPAAITPREPGPEPKSDSKWARCVTLEDLPRLLLTNDMVTQEQMECALAEQRRTGAYLGDILVEEQVIDEGALVAFLAKHYNIPHLCLRGYSLDESLLSLVTRDVCLRHHVVPIDRLGKNLTLAMVNPFDAEALRAIHQRCGDLQIRPILCTRCHYQAVAEDVLERRHRIGEICGPLRRRTDLPADSLPQPDSRPLIELRTLGNQPSCFASSERLAPTQSGERLPRVACQRTPATIGVECAVPPNTPAQSAFPQQLCHGGKTPPSEDDLMALRPGSAEDASFRSDIAGIEVTTTMVSAMKNTFHALLQRVSLFRGLAPETAAQLFARARLLEPETGATICRRGDDSRCVYAVLSGNIEICDPSGAVNHALPGETFGEGALFNNTASSISARAAVPSSLLQFTLQDITQNLPPDTVVQLMLNINVTLNRRLRTAQTAQ